MMLSDEKQDINSDFNHVKHTLKGMDQRSTVITAELLTGLWAFFPLEAGKKSLLVDNSKPWGTKGTFFPLYLELMPFPSGILKEVVNLLHHQQFKFLDPQG